MQRFSITGKKNTFCFFPLSAFFSPTYTPFFWLPSKQSTESLFPYANRTIIFPSFFLSHITAFYPPTPAHFSRPSPFSPHTLLFSCFHPCRRLKVLHLPTTLSLQTLPALPKQHTHLGERTFRTPPPPTHTHLITYSHIESHVLSSNPC